MEEVFGDLESNFGERKFANVLEKIGGELGDFRWNVESAVGGETVGDGLFEVGGRSLICTGKFHSCSWISLRNWCWSTLVRLWSRTPRYTLE